METIAYAAINKNDAIRNESSSGGVFYELAEKTIDNHGIVYGVKYDKNWAVVHGHTENINGLKDFLGSKYVQSSIVDEYKSVEKNLRAGRKVLFSGTTCQIEGLKHYLGQEYENLFTVDFICHGVPSPVVWKKYLEDVADGREITAVSFRDKTEGWLRFSLKIDFSDGTQHRQIQQDDLYMKGFLQNIYLRPSCYQCRFKTIERNTDITLADYWGVDQALKEMFDDRGTSLIMIHSNAGKKLWEEVASSFRLHQIDIGEVTDHNTNAVASVELPSKRADFYGRGLIDFKYLNSLTRIPISKTVIRNMKKMVKKLIGRK